MEEFQVKAVICTRKSDGKLASEPYEKQYDNGLIGKGVYQQAVVTEEGHPLEGELIDVARTIVNKEMASLIADGEEVDEKTVLNLDTEITAIGRVSDGILRFDAKGQEFESTEDKSARLLALMGQKTTIKA